MMGGLAIFLYGMNLMSEGINKSSGTSIRNLLQSFTKNRFSSLTTGVISTAVLQSSSAVSVMTIGFVKAGVLPFRNTIGILLGAGIGTTITAQIIAFKIFDYALLIVALGFFMSLLKKETLRILGQALLGFGLLFFGLHLMSAAMEPLRTHEPFVQLLATFSNPLTGIMAGMVFTALIQSSSAFIGILIVLGSQGMINLEAAIALLLGSNVGTTFTSILASFNAGVESKKVAVAFFIIKLTGALLIVFWIPRYAQLLQSFEGTANLNPANILPRQIANAHTLFNALVTLFMLPFTNSIARGVEYLLPSPKKPVTEPLTRYIDYKVIENHSAAMTLLKKEILVMAEKIEIMLECLPAVFIDKDSRKLEIITQNEQVIRKLRPEIRNYILTIIQQDTTKKVSVEAFKLLYAFSEMSEFAKEIYGGLYRKASEWMKTDARFSNEGEEDLQTFFNTSMVHFRTVVQIINDLDKKQAKKYKNEHKEIRKLADGLKQKHYERLSLSIPETIQSSKMHMQITGILRIMHSHLANIARIIARDIDQDE